ncbi:hypothetical protein DFJ69_6329 [Thermomonospora umbrina]|uniref:Uncharacterized protein n=1 Tax=Thermomonospora umbrina TaxID=111806 RepID=A0A3D9SXR5_9ACTN|nr:hypothetical protein DFJ69_6329 [Thermomonospora umbrina]
MDQRLWTVPYRAGSEVAQPDDARQVGSDARDYGRWVRCEGGGDPRTWVRGSIRKYWRQGLIKGSAVAPGRVGHALIAHDRFDRPARGGGTRGRGVHGQPSAVTRVVAGAGPGRTDMSFCTSDGITTSQRLGDSMSTKAVGPDRVSVVRRHTAPARPAPSGRQGHSAPALPSMLETPPGGSLYMACRARTQMSIEVGRVRDTALPHHPCLLGEVPSESDRSRVDRATADRERPLGSKPRW